MVLHVLPELKLSNKDMMGKLNDALARVTIVSNSLSDHNGGYDAIRGLTLLLNQIVQQSCDLRRLLISNRMFSAGLVSRTLFELLVYVQFMISDKFLFERRGCAFYYSMYFEDIRWYLSGCRELLRNRRIINKHDLLTSRGAKEFNFFRRCYYSTFWNMLPDFSYKKLNKISYHLVHYGIPIECQNLDKVSWYDEKCAYGPNGNFYQFCHDIVHPDGYDTVYRPLCSFVHGINYVGEMLPDTCNGATLGCGYYNMDWAVNIYQKILDLLWDLLPIYSGVSKNACDIIYNFFEVNKMIPNISKVTAFSSFNVL